ncbi:MAG: type I-E CRISPR-associated endonuclease Cas1 [Spirochaetes bacterium]|nr:type I-E CRISPR-associated endonuclease Cas1 [Spirochaetota bacterium]MBN2770108.1 type I-E CRISPR-associated endonuclease Cas1 [Spirochaetota bacterium]
MANRNLQEIPKFEDKLSYLYFEKGHICEHQRSIAYHYKEKYMPIPVETIALLMLGPGTTITHEAIKRTAECRCLIGWVGEQGVRMYSAGYSGTYTATSLLKQASQWADETKRLQTIIRMYQFRFPGELPDNITVEKLRGKEGYRVRKTYERLADEYGIAWSGRNYDQNNWDWSDPTNRAISSANSTLYGIVHAAILTAGFSPAIGFIHTGKQLSFVYDIADLYKTEITLPVAFDVAANCEDNLEREVRFKLREVFRKEKLMKRIIPDIKEVLFGNPDSGTDTSGLEGRDVAISY